jgi:hypothetical protein
MRTPTPMSNELFQNYLTERMDAIRVSLQSKGEEYAYNGDRMFNFNEGLRLNPRLYKTREDVLESFLTKHLTSLTQILGDLQKGKYPTKALLEEKLGDIINYYILMEISIKHGLDVETPFQNTIIGKID